MIRGQKFELNLDDGDEQPVIPPPSFSSIGDVLERRPAAASPPSAPTLKSKTGFPEHGKRKVESRFKQRKAADGSTQTATGSNPSSSKLPFSSQPSNIQKLADRHDDKPEDDSTSEKRQIDQQNRQQLAGMSGDEIEEARRELMASLDPALLQRLLKRSNIDSGSNESDLAGPSTSVPQPQEQKPSERRTESKRVAFVDDVRETSPPRAQSPQPPPHDHIDASPQSSLDPNSDDTLSSSSIHFPQPSQPPSLDPSSSTFLTDLHEKYFPSLPSDPSKLDWMRPTSSSSSPNDRQDTYSANSAALNASEIRFSFTGALIPPRLAAEIPVSAGLHHHGLAPDAAGYTIAELAILSRSTYAAQRCIAFQTLGRILYRLGRGEFGDAGADEADDADDSKDGLAELARGLWREMDKERVVDHLTAESEGNGVDGGKHISARAYATEALWLWNKGGGRRWKAE